MNTEKVLQELEQWLDKECDDEGWDDVSFQTLAFVRRKLQEIKGKS